MLTDLEREDLGKSAAAGGSEGRRRMVGGERGEEEGRDIGAVRGRGSGEGGGR